MKSGQSTAEQDGDLHGNGAMVEHELMPSFSVLLDSLVTVLSCVQGATKADRSRRVAQLHFIALSERVAEGWPYPAMVRTQSTLQAQYIQATTKKATC